MNNLIDPPILYASEILLYTLLPCMVHISLVPRVVTFDFPILTDIVYGLPPNSTEFINKCVSNSYPPFPLGSTFEMKEQDASSLP